jgi:hypothetical protein
MPSATIRVNEQFSKILYNVYFHPLNTNYKQYMIHYTQYIIIAEYLRVSLPRVSLSGSIKGFNVVQEKVKNQK